MVTILTSELEEVVEVLEGSVYSLSGSLLNDTFECSFFNILSFDMPQQGTCITWYCLAEGNTDLEVFVQKNLKLTIKLDDTQLPKQNKQDKSLVGR